MRAREGKGREENGQFQSMELGMEEEEVRIEDEGEGRKEERSKWKEERGRRKKESLPEMEFPLEFRGRICC